jgi:symplekin
MDAAPPGVRVCCVKFLQQVVLVQTPGVVDPRVKTFSRAESIPFAHTWQRPDYSDISLALVPRDHPLLPYVSLEAEGQGLLDRLLDIIHGDHRSDRQIQCLPTELTCSSDGLLVTATLNTLGVLMHRRPIAGNKILTSIFNFNPLKLASSQPLTPRNKVIMKSIERTTKSLMMNIMKRYASACWTST